MYLLFTALQLMASVGAASKCRNLQRECLAVYKGSLDAALHSSGEPLDPSPSLASTFLDTAGAEGKRVEPRAGLGFQSA